MKKLAFILFVILMVPCCAVYAQDCSERIQAAGRIYEKYKKTYDKKMFEEARKQLVNIKNTPGAPENCKKEAERLLKEWKPVYKPTTAMSNVDVKSMVVRVDTVVSRHVKVDSVVNVVFHHDSLKANRFYASESAAIACVERKDYQCAADNYKTAIAYGRELHLGDDILNNFQDLMQRNQKLQFNLLLEEAKQLEDEGNVHEALLKYQAVKDYGTENQLLDERLAKAFNDKTDYLEFVEQMFGYAKQADEYYQTHEWELAKQELEMAIELSDTLGWKKGVVYWKHRLDTVNRILQAADNIFDYATLDEASYNRMNSQLTTALQDALLHFETVASDTMQVNIMVTSDGKSEMEIQLQHEDSVLTRVMTEEIEKTPFRLPIAKYYGQSVTAKATYDFVVSVESAISVVTRTPKRIKEEPLLIGLDAASDYIQKTGDTVKKVFFKQDCKDFLFGKFYMNQSVVQVNNNERSGFHLTKYSGTGGPANALLSMVVPGLGRHRVTYGQQNGVATAVFFYVSVAASMGLYYGAYATKDHTYKFTDELKHFFKFGDMKNEWNRLATISPDPEDKGATDLRRTAYVSSYVFAGIAATLYVTDVIYTLVRGSINLSRQKKYKDWSIGVFYEPASKTPILQYNYKIK